MSGLGASRAVVGRAYLEVYPDEASVARLVELIGVPADELASATDGTAALPWFRQRIAEDFRTGRTVLVRGWVLSRTEARVCALASLAAAG